MHVGSSIWFQAELWRRRRLCERPRGAAVKHSGEPTAVMIPQTDLLPLFSDRFCPFVTVIVVF